MSIAMPRSLSSYKKEVVLAAAAYSLRRGPTMFAARAKKRSGSSTRNERVSVWFRGLSVRNIALGIKQIVQVQDKVNVVLLGACNNLNQSTAARPVAALMYCTGFAGRPVWHPIVFVHMHAGRTIPLLHAALSPVRSQLLTAAY